MKKPFISGFTIVRNAVKFDYPIVESIRSILPMVDEFVVSVGNSEDNTLELIQAIDSPKIRIVQSVWDDSLREGGRVLAVETDRAYKHISAEADWCFYLQADEVVHEQYHPAILKACETYLADKRIEGLLFGYKHFYGSYDYIGDSRKWYRTEIRIVRHDPGITSFRDAQGFRLHNRLMRVKPIDAFIYHYGWVKDPRSQQAKQEQFHKMWHDDDWMEKNVAKADAYDYSLVDSLNRFEGTHPAVMEDRLKRMHWTFEYDLSKKKFDFKNWLLYLIERLTGKRLFEYKNYKEI
ncbi:MAG: glycosyltransferase family 2 protein [Bacteroidia bacterium]|jgi:glycosyltransferase involved in cell wall biosynthesis